jgi:peptidase YpeB-like protein
MRMRKPIAAAIVVLAVAGGGAIAYAATNDSEGGVTGPGAERARDAALQATGGGTATAVERDEENGGTWEVEVRRPDGSVVDVRLDESYRLVVIDGDSESADTGDGSN